ncbi:hypothetical protein CC2G_007885 [Coprinopsis cinerea AmutBmut pab1-1]|nr:hypothetical protein CC2G_007885 [Coprinopsis cinerea AmutBmut pab1-1]
MDTIKQDSVRFVQFCIQFASLTLVYYDYLLTLGREVQYVWRRKFHVLTVIFFFCRYSTISNVVFLFGLVHKFDKIRSTAHLFAHSCDTAYLISAVLSIFGRIGVLTVLGVRTCAVYRNNRAIVALFTVMGLFVIALAIAHAPRVSCSGQKVKESRIN